MSASTSPPSEAVERAAGPPSAPAAAAPAESFAFADWRGEVVAALRPADLEAEVARLSDPSCAVDTLHWGRNYIYLAHLESAAGRLPVAVKQFRNQGQRQRLKRRLAGSKAEKSWRVGRALLDAGILTPEPVMLVESRRDDGPSFYLCRHLDGVLEARYLLRAVNAGNAAAAFPDADVDAFLVALARTLRRLHDAGFWHRDMSSGNVLIRWHGQGSHHAAAPDLYLLDLNRTRQLRRLSTSQRSRDLSRMMIHRRADQRRFLDAYWTAPADVEIAPGQVRAGAAGRVHRILYALYHHGFRFKNDFKRTLRRRLRGIVQAAKDLVLPRGHHAHIPDAPEGTATRDRVVWDHLSDQPHLHAGKAEKLLTRLRDSPAHLRSLAAAAAAAPRTLRRYRKLTAERWAEPVAMDGVGVALRPYPADPQALLAAVDDLGVRHLLLRLHPWQEEHGAELELARELAARGHELAFSLPQCRDLVRDLVRNPGRWRAAVEELAASFAPYGSTFVVGQAVNRSKWGVWQPGEYRRLAGEAVQVLRRTRGADGAPLTVLGPGVIDFEPLATLGLVNYPGMPRLDGLASLLYVDRRGAPEAEQMGYDAAGKAMLLRAAAETAKHCGPRSWITEVNWPLREGPHAPAGRSVSVDEETQADYLARYYLAVLGSGAAQRVYWWQLVARGYGLACPEEGGSLRRRPSWRALATLLRQLGGTRCEGPLPGVPEEARALRFRHEDGSLTVAAWTVGTAPVRIALPGAVVEAHDRDGSPLTADAQPHLSPSPAYFRLAG